MSWLRRIDTLILHQNLDIPFITRKNGVYLCFDNFYSEKPQDTGPHTLSFQINKSKVFRKSTYYYSFRDFPVVVPFHDVISLDDFIKDGKVYQETVPVSNSQTHHIAIVKTKYLKHLSDRQFDNFIDAVDGFKRIYVLNGGVVDERVHVLADMLDSVKILYHQDWNRTLVTMLADNASNTGFCWINGLPQMQLTCIGITDEREMEEMTSFLAEIEINYSIHWL